jgi:hypothetical protein
MEPSASPKKTFRARLRDIQRAPEPVRKRWLAIVSTATMVAVVGLWMLYLNLTVPNPSAAAATSTPPAVEEPQKSGDSFWGTLGRGFSAIADEFQSSWNAAKEKVGAAFRDLSNALSEKNQFTVEAPTSTPASPGRVEAGPAAPEDATAVPPTPLPEAPLATSTIH